MDPTPPTLDQTLAYLLEQSSKNGQRMEQLMGVVQASQAQVVSLTASHAAMQALVASSQSGQPSAFETATRSLEEANADQQAEVMTRSQAMMASARSSQLPSLLKVQPLRTFTGVRGKSDDLDAWMFQVEQLFRMANVQSDEMRVDYAGQALAGHAATWFYSRRREGALNRLTTWEDFKVGLRSQFQGTDTYEQAKDQLYKLLQGKDSLQQYTDQFLQLHTVVGDVSERDLMFLYKRGLKSSLQREVLRSNPTSFSEMLEMVERVENIFLQTQSDWKPARPLRDAPAAAASQTGQAPMDLGAMQSGHGKPEADHKVSEEQKRRRAENLCYGCGKEGHIRKDCKTHPWKPKKGPGNG